jgi:NCAIR mutase (PurE)-related protein
MNPERLADLLEQVRRNQVSVADAMARLRHLPFEDLGFAKIDHHRALRQGFPEVVMGQGKDAKQIAAIVEAIRQKRNNVLVTRLDSAKAAQLKRLRTGADVSSCCPSGDLAWEADQNYRQGYGARGLRRHL